MKTIRTFIGSSINDMKSERLKIGVLINRLNRYTTELEIPYINFLEMCEYKSYTVTNKRTQDILNERIKPCDFAIFMVKEKIGEYTLEELEYALTHKYDEHETNIIVLVSKKTIHSETVKIKEVIKRYEHTVKINYYDNLYDILWMILESLNNRYYKQYIKRVDQKIYFNDVLIV